MLPDNILRKEQNNEEKSHKSKTTLLQNLFLSRRIFYCFVSEFCKDWKLVLVDKVSTSSAATARTGNVYNIG